MTTSPRVYIFDLDETLILFQSLLDGAYARSSGRDHSTGAKIGATFEALVLGILDAHAAFDEPTHAATVAHAAHATDCMLFANHHNRTQRRPLILAGIPPSGDGGAR